MAPIHDLLAATLTGLGLPAPTNVIQTMLLHDGYFVGHKFRYDSGYAIMRAGEGVVFTPQQTQREFLIKVSSPKFCHVGGHTGGVAVVLVQGVIFHLGHVALKSCPQS
jgi:hypothetical protein